MTYKYTIEICIQLTVYRISIWLFDAFTFKTCKMNEVNIIPETCVALNGGRAECTMMQHATCNRPRLLNIHFLSEDPPSHQLRILPVKGGPETPI